MQNKNTWVWVVLGVVVVGLIVFFIVRANKNSYSDNPGAGGDTPVTALEPTEDVSQGSVNASTASGSTGNLLSYNEALAFYKDRRIQFDTNCQAIPNNITFKNNTNIMIDNRSAESRTIKIGTTYTVKGYGFKIIKLSAGTLPTTYLVDCNSQQNVATILVQK